MDAMKRVIAKRIREARELAGLSQGDVAKSLGLHRPSISEAEAGHRTVTAEEIVRMSKLYKVDVRWLLGVLSEGDATDASCHRCQLLAAALRGVPPVVWRELSSLAHRVAQAPSISNGER